MFRQALVRAGRSGARRTNSVDQHRGILGLQAACQKDRSCFDHPIGYPFYPKRSLTSTANRASGHNKWSKIRHNKAIQDSKKNLLYNKLQKDILIAAQVGGSPDPESNANLAQAIKKAKTQGLPKANLDRTLAKASGGGDAGGQEIIYEIMTNDSVGLMVSFVSDNPARAKQAMNKIVKGNGARFTPTSYLFTKKAVVRIELPASEADQHLERLWDVAIELGAEDVVNQATTDDNDNGTIAPSSGEEGTDGNDKVEIEIIGPPNLLGTLSSTLSKPPYSFQLTESELQWRPKDAESAKASADALSEESKEALQALIDELEEAPECAGVWCSID